jgi:23S rRNA pseudouridine2605 synthase
MKTAFGYIGADSFTRQRQESRLGSRGPSNGSRRGGRNK